MPFTQATYQKGTNLGGIRFTSLEIDVINNGHINRAVSAYSKSKFRNFNEGLSLPASRVVDTSKLEVDSFGTHDLVYWTTLVRVSTQVTQTLAS